MANDVYLILEYNVKDNSYNISKTNIKLEMIDEFLGDAFRSQIGEGTDKNPLNRQEKYSIEIYCDLSEDIFSFKSDTGNLGLMTGIIWSSIGEWKIKPSLEEISS